MKTAGKRMLQLVSRRGSLKTKSYQWHKDQLISDQNMWQYGGKLSFLAITSLTGHQNFVLP